MRVRGRVRVRDRPYAHHDVAHVVAQQARGHARFKRARRRRRDLPAEVKISRRRGRDLPAEVTRAPSCERLDLVRVRGRVRLGSS